MGKHGLRTVAELCYHKAHYAARLIGELVDYKLVSYGPFFKEFVVRCPGPVAEVNKLLLDEYGIVGGYDLGMEYPTLADHMLICVTEMNSREDIEALAAGLEEFAGLGGDE
jgi:glycine dehydrogenase subunit 1